MDQNQRNAEEIVENLSNGGENQDSDEEIGENRSRDEETVDENQSSGEETGEYQNSDDNEWVGRKRCVLSDPAHPHYLSRRNGYKTNQKCCWCGERDTPWTYKKFHYYCTICEMEFHRMCHTYPSKIIHPYHPQHPLTFTFLNKETGMIVDTNYGEYMNYDQLPIGSHKTFETLSSSSLLFDKCTWCASVLGDWFYRCLICNFSLDLDCNLQNPPFTIPNPKSHHHPLSLFPRPALFPCNACGLVDVVDPSYACYQCNYVVHQSCIGLPRVIKITRHPHRLSHFPHLPTQVSSCRVCYKNVDIKYGQYSCHHGNCSYVVHSNCATHRRVWDGKELEWEPNEAEDIVAPYKEISGGLIEHFSHPRHYLKLEKYDDSSDLGKQCQACMHYFLSSSDDFYNCVECEFFIHEVCANLPTKLDHGLHNHSLYLDPNPLLDWMHLDCKVSQRNSSCWKYRCKRQKCLEEKVQLDVNCILVPECFTHGSHEEHPLFMFTMYRDYHEGRCHECKDKIFRSGLQCTVCEFALCYKCATIPDKLYCKYYEHPLSLCYGESGVMDDIYWCEVCEKRLDPREWFYTNNECCTTIHVKCVFGDSAFVKSGHTFDYMGRKVEAVSNNNSSRHVCRRCQHRCPHPVYFKMYSTDGTTFDVCSFDCLRWV